MKINSSSNTKMTDQSSIRNTKASSDYWDHFSYWDETIKTGLIRHNIRMISRIGMLEPIWR